MGQVNLCVETINIYCGGGGIYDDADINVLLK